MSLNNENTIYDNVLQSTLNISSDSDREEQHEIAEKKLRVVNYVSENHFSVLTQMTGSVWKMVLPYCIGNTLLTYTIYKMKEMADLDDIGFSDKGHTFMSMLVSFLVVTRSSIAYDRFQTAQAFIVDCTSACSELIQHCVCFTRNETSTKAKEWRRDVARRTIVLLRTLTNVLQYQSKGEHAWKTVELSRCEKKALLEAVGKSNERTPIVLTLFLRSTIVMSSGCLDNNIHASKELYLLKFVSDFVTAYHGLMQLIQTPFPFPLVQMARTFLFLWVFTLPMTLVREFNNIYALLLIVFTLTYGFVGLEYVSIELDDPFGDDPCDFDISGWVDMVSKDILVCIYDIDGRAAANELKNSLDPSQLEHTTTKPSQKKKRTSIEVFKASKPLNPSWMHESKLMADYKTSNNSDEKKTEQIPPTISQEEMSENEPLLKEEP